MYQYISHYRICIYIFFFIRIYIYIQNSVNSRTMRKSTRSAIYCYGTLVWRIVAGLSFCQQAAHLNTTEVTSKIHTLLHSEFSHVSRKFSLTFRLFPLWIQRISFSSFSLIRYIFFNFFFYSLSFIFIFSINFLYFVQFAVHLYAI